MDIVTAAALRLLDGDSLVAAARFVNRAFPNDTHPITKTTAAKRLLEGRGWRYTPGGTR